MSQSIWTQCAGSSRLRRLEDRAWRAVEAQHVVSSKLVDSAEEQEALERMIESAKPPLVPVDEFAGYHFLLTTSFRYPPLPHGSRFGTRFERSLWYGSRELRTAFAEVAYYRLVFLSGTAAAIDRLDVDLSVFRVPIRARRGVDLTRPPFDVFAERISSPKHYSDSQQLGSEMRAAGVDALRYRSARDRGRGANLALFTPRAFGAKRPALPQTWHCGAMRDRVELVKKDVLDHGRYDFRRKEFEVRGELPAPAL